MKKIFFFVVLFVLCNVSKAQSAYPAMSNHVFLMCESDGTPLVMYGQAVYMTFYESGQCIMLMGSDLSKAISNGAKKTGKWTSAGGSAWWTWSDGKRSDDWIVYGDGNFYSGSSMLKDLGAF